MHQKRVHFLDLPSNVVILDKILEALSTGNTTKRSPLLTSTLNTTSQYGSCNQAYQTQSQLIQAIRNIAYQPKEL
jgi:hypothetical protein